MFTQNLIELLSALSKENLNSLVEEVSSHEDGYVVRFTDGSDVAIHWGTYGNEEGLWESYRMPQDEDDVTGWLSPADIVARLKENFNL